MSLWEWLFRRGQREEDLEEEIQAHLHMAVQERMGHGETGRQARASALREFGNVALVKDITRDLWGWSSCFETSARQIQLALRTLLRRRGIYLYAIGTLALGIGVATRVTAGAGASENAARAASS